MRSPRSWRPRLEAVERRPLMAANATGVVLPVMTAELATSSGQEVLTIQVEGQAGRTPFRPATGIVARSVEIDGVHYATTVKRSSESNGGIPDATITVELPAGTFVGPTVVVTAQNRAGTRSHSGRIAGIVAVSTGLMGSQRSSTSVSASPNPVPKSQSVTVTARVSGNYNGITPSGSVTFSDNGSYLGFGQLIGGSTTLITPLLFSGNNSIVGNYSGDNTYAPSTSPPIVVKVTG